MIAMTLQLPGICSAHLGRIDNCAPGNLSHSIHSAYQSWKHYVDPAYEPETLPYSKVPQMLYLRPFSHFLNTYVDCPAQCC